MTRIAAAAEFDRTADLQDAGRMFTIREPSQSTIDSFWLRAQTQEFSYTEIGSTHRKVPVGYTVDHNRMRLGSGKETFLNAISALRTWEMFNLGWVRLFQPNTPFEVNTTVVLLVHHFGFWSLNACRVVYKIEEERRFGFAYGTLQQHAAQGEERFSVEWEPKDDSVFYDILAFSKPSQWQTRIARPLSRMLQKKFVRDSAAAMQGAVQTNAVQRLLGPTAETRGG